MTEAYFRVVFHRLPGETRVRHKNNPRKQHLPNTNVQCYGYTKLLVAIEVTQEKFKIAFLIQ
jgi:hypothetical protein